MKVTKTVSLVDRIATDRLVLRTAHISHAHDLQTYLLENRTYLQPWEPLRDDVFFEIDTVADRLQLMEQKTASGDALHFLLFHSDGHRMVGVCNFTNIVRGAFQACHLGFSLAEKAQGQELMREGLEAAITHVFEDMKLHRVMANYRPQNVRSARLLTHLGFELEGKARAYLQINGAWADHLLTSLINPKTY